LVQQSDPVGLPLDRFAWRVKKTIEEELGWDDQQSKYLRQVVPVLEEQLVQLCTDWKITGGSPERPLAEM
jgi:hypothetical protein